MPSGEKLKKTKQQAVEVITEYLITPANYQPTSTDNVKGHYVPFSRATNQYQDSEIFELYQMVMRNNRIKDQELGIRSYYIQIAPNDPNQWLYLRDARTICSDLHPDQINKLKYKNDFINWALTYFIACKRIANLYGLKLSGIDQLAKDYSKKYFDDLTNSIDIKPFELITKILSELSQILFDAFQKSEKYKNITLEEINNMLDCGNKWAAMELPTISIATVEKINGQVFVNLETPVCELSLQTQDTLKQDLNSRKWFTQLSEYEQKLARFYVDLYKEENRIIPSQLRDKLPFGNKNHYQHTLFAVDTQNAEPRLDSLTSYFHSGTVVYCNPDLPEDMLKGAIDSLLQQGLAAGNDVFHFMSLNSEYLDIALKFIATITDDDPNSFIDRHIVKTTKQAADALAKKGFFATNLCLNGERKFVDPKFSNINNLLKIFSANRKYLENNLTRFSSKIRTSLQLLRYFQKTLKELLQNWNDLKWRDRLNNTVHELDLSALVNILCHLNNEIINELKIQAQQKETGVTTIDLKCLKSITSAFACASGENRTLINSAHSNIFAKYHYLLNNLTSNIDSITDDECKSQLNVLVNNILRIDWSVFSEECFGLKKNPSNMPASFKAPKNILRILVDIDGATTKNNYKATYINILKFITKICSQKNAIDYFVLIIHPIIMSTAASFHFQMMAGHQGGTLGTEGIRDKSQDSIPSYYPEEAKLLLVGPKNVKKPADQKNMPKSPAAKTAQPIEPIEAPNMPGIGLDRFYF